MEKIAIKREFVRAQRVFKSYTKGKNWLILYNILMYFCDKGIVLRHRDIREFDRVITIFTKEHGRLEVMFKGVRKPQAKLRSFSELMCHSDFRFYLSKYGAMPLCIGAGLIDDYAALRNNFEKMMSFIFIADMVISLTPLNQRSYEKYKLILAALNYLSHTKTVSKWFKVVFAMNFLQHFGTGYKETQLGYDPNLWQILHSGFDEIDKLDAYDKYYSEVCSFAFSQVNEYSQKEIIPQDYEIGRRYEFSGYNK